MRKLPDFEKHFLFQIWQFLYQFLLNKTEIITPYELTKKFSKSCNEIRSNRIYIINRNGILGTVNSNDK